MAELFPWLAEELCSNTAEYVPDTKSLIACILSGLWIVRQYQRKLSVTIGIHLRGNSQSKTLCGNKHKIYFRPCLSWLFLLASFNTYQSSCWLLINVLRHLFVHVHWTKCLSGERGAGRLRHSAAESCCDCHSQTPHKPTELPAETFPLVKHSTKASRRHKPVQSKTDQPTPLQPLHSLQINATFWNIIKKK